MSIKLPHTCPKCKRITANNTEELLKYFGLRQTDVTHIREQSWCKSCRGNKNNYSNE